MKPGPNDPCPCGSGKKHKRCCGNTSAPRGSESLTPPFDGKSALQLAVQHHQAGRLDNAEAAYRQILEFEPNNANALHLLGLIAHQSGEHLRAASLIRRALSVAPNSPFFRCNLGVVLLALGNLNEAIACYERAVALKPDYAEAHNNLGVAKMQQGKLTEAAASCQRALAVTPNYAEAHYNLGLTLLKQDRPAEATVCFERALGLRPDYAAAHEDLGTALQRQGRFDEAVARYQEALRLRPSAEAHNKLGAALQDQGRLDEAVTHYEQALSIDPQFPDAHFNLGGLLLDQGKLEQSIACFERAQQLMPNDRNRIALATAWTPVIESSGDLPAVREQCLRRITQLLQADLAIEDPLGAGLGPNFMLAYHGLDDRQLQEATARLYLKACPSLSWTAPHCLHDQNIPAGVKTKIGLVSRYFYNHTIGEVMHGLIEHINRDRFDVTVFRFPGPQDHVSRRIDDSADHVFRLPYSLAGARNLISESRLDVLVYPEIGMDPATYFIAFSRLAPVQCVMWGHPDTTGIPNIDYFVSSSDVEPVDAQDHYAEKLVTLQHVPTYYCRPPPVTNAPDRKALGLPESAHLYVCPQTLYKFHPDFDAILGAILRRDPQGVIVLFHGRHPAWATSLRDRFARSCPDVADRIVFLRRLPREHYLGLLQQADAVLDTLHFGGGNTTYQAFGLGVPVVTWPGSFARGRVTYALYKRMGVMDLVADRAERYVELAWRLANDEMFRQQMRTGIRNNSSVIFEDLETVQELELFFNRARGTARTGCSIVAAVDRT